MTLSPPYLRSLKVVSSASGLWDETQWQKLQHIFLPRTISNRDLLAQCQQEDTETIISRKRWRWIGHMLCKDANSTTKAAIHWTPEEKLKCGQLKTTWQRSVEVEIKNMNHSWGTIQRLASDRQRWRSFVAALYASLHDGQWWYWWWWKRGLVSH